MKKLLLLISLIACWAAFAQQKLTFDYDRAGNQILRELCLSGCTPQRSEEAKPIKVEALIDEDLQKFSPEDVISYYPNPVKEELYLRWELKQENHVTSIAVYDLQGKILKTYTQTAKFNSQNIPFQNYPSGVYIVGLYYANGDQKIIKIIKQ